MAAPQRHDENPFMAAALAPRTGRLATPNFAQPTTTREATIVAQDREDLFSQAGLAAKAYLAVESIQAVSDHATLRFQQGQTHHTELEARVDRNHRDQVVQFNEAVTVAAGNGMLRVITEHADAQARIANRVHHAPEAATTYVKQPVGWSDAWRGYVWTKTTKDE